MKASELRKGNYISIDEMLLNELLQEIGIITEDKQFNISLISNDYCNIIIENQEIEIDIKDLEPIPITEDWLVKFGFKQDIDDYDFLTYPKGVNKYHDLLSIHKTKLDIYIGHGIDWTNEFNNIKNVHQLQNLYFALTGKELTYESN